MSANLDTPMRLACIVILSVLVCFGELSAQQPVVLPTPDDAIRIPTEEVHLTLRAEGPYVGRRPNLRAEDFTIFEDGAAQTVTSIRNVPPRVIVLVDTGAALTFAKTSQVSALLAQIVVNNLPEGSHLSVAQYSDRAETLVDWTTDQRRAVTELEGNVRIGRRSLLSNALAHVRAGFASQPVENRHLILITDGLDGWNAVDAESPELAALAASNIVVHVLGYTALEQEGAKQAGKTVRLNTRVSKPRVPTEIFDEMIQSLPVPIEVKEFLRMQNGAQQIVILDLDGERRKMLRGRRVEWEKAETRLSVLASETGGNVETPVTPAELFVGAAKIASDIAAFYAVTYTPKQTLADSTGRKRTVSVESRVASLKFRTRQSFRTRR